MFPLRSIIAAALFCGCSVNAMVTPRAPADESWTITVSNATTTGSTRLCGFAPKTITLTSATLNKCMPLGNTYDRWVDEAVGNSITIRQNCVFFFSNGDCTALAAAEDDVIDASLGGKNCKGSERAFDTIMYTDNCPTGSSG